MKTCITDRMIKMAENPDLFEKYVYHMLKKSGDYCLDIDYSFLGFMEDYKAISKAIPRRDVIIDVGCAAGFQQVFFRHHHQYIGINEHECGQKPLQKNAIFTIGEFKDVIDHVLKRIVSKKSSNPLFIGEPDIFGIANMSILYHSRIAENLKKFHKIFKRGFIR